MSILPQITNVRQHAFDFSLSFLWIQQKLNMYLTIEIHRMFLNVATVSVTNRSISFIKKKIDFFKHFYLIF
jgi:hypothetical protein